MVLVILLVGTFYEKELQKTNQEEFTVENVIRKKVNGKTMIVLLIIGLIKNAQYKWVNTFQNRNL